MEEAIFEVIRTKEKMKSIVDALHNCDHSPPCTKWTPNKRTACTLVNLSLAVWLNKSPYGSELSDHMTQHMLDLRTLSFTTIGWHQKSCMQLM
jgi:hypothetical protein